MSDTPGTPITVAPPSKKELIEKARKVLRGEWMETTELDKLVIELENTDQFAYAADVLMLKITQEIAEGKFVALRDHQKLAKYIYKDHSLPSSFKFKKAMQQLNSHDELSTTENCETLGLTGAIYKYKWLYDQQRANLDLSIAYYSRGLAAWQNWLTLHQAQRDIKKTSNDDGYTAINCAHMLEVKAISEIQCLGNLQLDVLKTVDYLFEEARKIRIFIVDQFLQSPFETIKDKPEELKLTNNTKYDSWVYATLAEAFFGLRMYETSQHYLKCYLDHVGVSGDENVVAWKIRTTRRQFFEMTFNTETLVEWLKGVERKLDILEYELAQKSKACEDGLMQDAKSDNQLLIGEAVRLKAYKIIFEKLLKGIDKQRSIDTLVLLSVKTNRDAARPTTAEIKKKGKVGLALSGGGFRASLYHIGVLAALAERDMLRDIEVISCVSGGSIIGAFYYLRLKSLLESRKDQEIKQKDYIELVKDIEKEFLAGVKMNLRMRVLRNLWYNLKMIFWPGYSRTHRLGELYEIHLYRRVKGFERKTPIHMDDLFITPEKNAQNPPTERFNIATDNIDRTNKVPQLILNATSVNTGHNWQFTASWMGEPPGSIHQEFDVKPRLRRMYYNDAPDKFKRVRLGHAVGASSCVPVMFTPLPMKGLYPGLDLELVDGGVHDNQGIAALLEQECSNMIISDASGQMATSLKGESNELQMFYRADTILQERIRELQFRDLIERKHSSMLRNLLAVHLKADLQQPPIKWKNCTDPTRPLYEKIEKEDENDLTCYGIIRKVQQQLSEVRTDLDCFHDIEAYALMYSAYRQTHYELDKGKINSNDRCKEWSFLAMEEFLTNPEKADKIDRHLKIAKKVALKVFELNRVLKYTSISIGLILTAILIYFGVVCYKDSITLIKAEKEINISVSTLLNSFLLILATFVVSERIAKFLKVKSWIRKRIVLVAGALIMWVVSNIYLWIFNPIYELSGKIRKETKPDPREMKQPGRSDARPVPAP